jgi:hypothetical protein
MALTRDNLPKEMTPFGKGAKKAKPFGGESKAPPFGGGPKKTNPFAEKAKEGPPEKKGKFPNFAKGGRIPAEDGPTHKAAMASNPPTNNPLDDGKPSGGGTARGGGKATKGKKFIGTF